MLLDVISDRKAPDYALYGWHQWPDHPALSFQFRRALGETQEGGGSVSECFQAASRMVPGDRESWHVEWLKVAERNRLRGDAAIGQELAMDWLSDVFKVDQMAS